jgi:hypothetical protein
VSNDESPPTPVCEVTGPGLLTDQEIADWYAVAQKAGPHEPWQYGPSPETEPDDVEKMLRRTYDAGTPGPVHMVHVPDAGADTCVVVAITGNGPTSEANAKFLAWSQPRNVLLALDELKICRGEVNALRAKITLLEVIGQMPKALDDAMRADLCEALKEADEQNATLATNLAAAQRAVIAYDDVLGEMRRACAARPGAREAEELLGELMAILARVPRLIATTETLDTSVAVVVVDGIVAQAKGEGTDA